MSMAILCPVHEDVEVNLHVADEQRRLVGRGCGECHPQSQLVVAGRCVHVVQHRAHASVTIPVGQNTYGVEYL